CFTNLVDFDSSYGHRRDPIGYGNLLEEFDKFITRFMAKMHDDDLLIITADHGNDPTFSGTDHTREHVPLIMYFNNCKGKKLGDNSTFANIGKTILDNFNVKNDLIGKSYLEELD
nr:phosphopentomutase [bacterium]